ncbi:hypothetical protein RKE29_08515 [Streptomyces sp. B1866]|uniref:hypothetical protein n=1 Tax=Streptomyces sp. B1866 TaxID=3075431 RepID=UPI0028909CB4|nr:hypothetical protein [Streptomyces sp. B1866]MDT3396680.1 hypothetical protein [Streptomyces sp. B1866]
MATAAAIAAVVAGTAAVQPSDARAGSAAAAPVRPPDADAAAYPVDCGPVRLDVVDRVSGDLDGDGRPETVAVVRCHAESGTPPSGIYVLAIPRGKKSGKPGRTTEKGARPPRVVATFLDPKERMSVQGLALRGATVSATLLGYSSDQVPRCCPDMRRSVSWRWKDGGFVLRALRAPGSV